MKSFWYVYILKCGDGSLYTGITHDVAARVKRHNQARGARFTSSRKPVHLVYSERFVDKGIALRREAEIKKLGHRGKEHLIRDSSSSLHRHWMESRVARDFAKS